MSILSVYDKISRAASHLFFEQKTHNDMIRRIFNRVAFAREQYKRTKSLFWEGGLIPGLKEYNDRWCPIGMDIDAGPILLGLSPSGTAFFAGPASYFGDTKVENSILRTAETAGHTVQFGHHRHYLLANVALVGEAIMLAMRTHQPYQ